MYSKTNSTCPPKALGDRTYLWPSTNSEIPSPVFWWQTWENNDTVAVWSQALVAVCRGSVLVASSPGSRLTKCHPLGLTLSPALLEASQNAHEIPKSYTIEGWIEIKTETISYLSCLGWLIIIVLKMLYVKINRKI